LKRPLAAWCSLVFLLGSREAEAQSFSPTFYYQNLPLWSEQTDFSPGGARDFNRLRLMGGLAFEEVRVDAAYEHLFTVREHEDFGGVFVGGAPSGGEWLPLQWTIEDTEHVGWDHRFDRLALAWSPSETFNLTVGRQAVSWATTLFLTPADPFSPFDPADPFREFRAGVDAVRAQVFPGPLSELDFVVRATESSDRTDVSALARGLTTWKNWELSAWGGSLYRELAVAGGAAGSLGPAAIRGELSLRRESGETVFRGTVGVDRRFTARSRDLYVVVEYQHDGFGAADADGYQVLLDSEPFLRGELQVLGRDELAGQAQYQLTPLWGVSLLGLWNLNDGSTLVSPSFSYSASDETTIAGGAFFGLGDDEVDVMGGLPSEYGVAGTTVYLSVSIFF
jgi:hypothetical protein